MRDAVTLHWLIFQASFGAGSYLFGQIDASSVGEPLERGDLLLEDEDKDRVGINAVYGGIEAGSLRLWPRCKCQIMQMKE